MNKLKTLKDMKLKIRSNYIKKDNKWKRRMEYFDKINNKWEELNNIDWHHFSGFIELKGGKE